MLQQTTAKISAQSAAHWPVGRPAPHPRLAIESKSRSAEIVRSPFDVVCDCLGSAVLFDLLNNVVNLRLSEGSSGSTFRDLSHGRFAHRSTVGEYEFLYLALSPLTAFRYVLFLILSISLMGCHATWSERGPAVGGRLSAIVSADPAGTVLIAASPGGGVWRSTDGGSTWRFPGQYGLGDNSGVHLEWDQATPGRLFLLTWNGLYATTNNGDSWTNLINPGGFPAPLQADQSAVADPKPFAQMLFAPGQRAVLAAIPCSGLYYSFDGITFIQHWPFPGGSANLDNCIGAIAADPFSGRVYFSTFAMDPFGAAHVFRSNCPPPVNWQPGTPCLIWQTANRGLPSNSIISALTSVATAAFADHLIAQAIGPGSTLNTYMTTDGLSWTLQSSQPVGWSPRTLVYTGHGQELLQGNVLASYSADFGAHWANFTVHNEHPDVRAIYPSVGAGKLWTATDGSFAGSHANVTRWNWTPGSPPVVGSGVNLGYSGLTIWQAYFANVIPTIGASSSRRVFAGSQDNGSLCSDSLGLSGWTQSGSPPGAGAGDIFAFSSAPSDPNRAYSWSGETVSFVMTTNAANALNCAAVAWSNVTPRQNPSGAQLVPPQYWSYHALTVHPTNPDRLYFAFLLDMGETTNASAPTPLVTHHALPNLRPTVIYVDADGAIYLGTEGQGAYKSVDDGVTWSAWGPATNPAPTLVTAITSSGGATPTFWIASTSGLYKQSPGGTWVLATGGGGYTVSDVDVDPSCPTRVYAAYGFAGIRGEHRGGIEFSSNNGASWTSITAGQVIHQGPVTMVQVDRLQSKAVYAATYGRGFWVYDWGTQLPACAP